MSAPTPAQRGPDLPRDCDYLCTVFLCSPMPALPTWLVREGVGPSLHFGNLAHLGAPRGEIRERQRGTVRLCSLLAYPPKSAYTGACGFPLIAAPVCTDSRFLTHPHPPHESIDAHLWTWHDRVSRHGGSACSKCVLCAMCDGSSHKEGGGVVGMGPVAGDKVS